MDGVIEFEDSSIVNILSIRGFIIFIFDLGWKFLCWEWGWGDVGLELII